MKTIDLLERPDLMANRIEKVLISASPESIKSGKDWYLQARFIANHIANKYNVPFSKVCGVISALSPATNWVRNIADACNLVYVWSQDLDCDKVVVTTYGNNKRKAIQILGLNGHHIAAIERLILGKSKVSKTASFFSNILTGDSQSVTIDRHAVRIALNRKDSDEICITEKRYRNIVEAYQIVAKKVNLSPSQVQAITWISFRENMPYNVPKVVSKLDPEIRAQIIG